MGNFRNLTGKRFGRLTVTHDVGTNVRGKYMWHCACDCGQNVVVISQSLVLGRTKSCGCLKHASYAETGRKPRITHGLTHSRAFSIWHGMKKRCGNPRDAGFPDYGGRGITVCARWQKFENFLSDMGHPPAGMSIERKDNDGNYEPFNCVWATKSQQGRNRRTNARISFNGETKTLIEWSEITGMPYGTLHSRLQHGWPHQRIISEPVDVSKRALAKRTP